MEDWFSGLVGGEGTGNPLIHLGLGWTWHVIMTQLCKLVPWSFGTKFIPKANFWKNESLLPS